MEITGYAIKRCIAEGGMAAAYLAEQTSLGRMVVLKVLDTSINESRLALRRFMNEGQLLAALKHPNVLTVYDIGTAADFIYISMEYVEGGDLKQRLAGGALPVQQALKLLESIAQGLGAAHAEGIVHRDVKPGNILFRADGTPLLSDFGIAKSLYRDADLTATGVFLGSPNYMAPEQADSGEIDIRADIYALGVILYEMLTGAKPFVSESVIDVIQMHKRAPIPLLPAPLSPLQPLLSLMLAKDRNDRFRNIPALLDYLGGLQRNGVIDALTSPSHPGSVANPATRVRWAGASGTRVRYALYGLLAVAAAGYGALFVVEADLAAPIRATHPGDNAGLTAGQAALAATPASATTAPGSVDTAGVVTAMLWLGQHSLNQQRLTSPPTDSAYYYFSRVLQLDPTNAAAHAGIAAIAKAYALLAESAMSRGEAAQARAYVALGRQLDPRNEALQVMAELATPPTTGFFATLRAWWR
jgi:tRNA A-37 threonylcarbamoyl transferase component Bud32